MEKANVILGVVIIAIVIQTGFIIYQYESIQSLNKEVSSVDNSLNSLAQELGLTKIQLQGDKSEIYSTTRGYKQINC